MPNWCHNKLVVDGPPAEVEAFAREAATDEQPLSFAAHVPQPSPEVYAAIEEAQKVRCDLCGGRGIRPVDEQEAKAYGAQWEASWEKMTFLRASAELAVDDRPRCNACQGEGRVVPFSGGWYGWCIDNWGTKWDANFGEPFMALGKEGSDVASTIALHGVLSLPGSARYEFTTAWSPPTPWLARVSAEKPELKFTLRFGEPGNEFAGEVVAEGGEIVSDMELSVSEVLSPEEMWF